MEGKTKQYLIVTVIGVTLFVALLNISDVLTFMGRIVNLLLPVIIGGILALFINVPLRGTEKRLKKLLKNRKRRPSDKTITFISFVITLVCIILVVILALTLLIPEIIRSCQSLHDQLEAVLPKWLGYLKDNNQIGWLKEWLSGLNWKQIAENISNNIDIIASNAVDAVSATVNTVTTAGFSIIVAIYISLEREMLCRHAVKFANAYLKPAHANGILSFCRSFRQSFASFLTGQCVEAVILGFLMFLAFTIFRVPYGTLAGVVTAIFALIPYVGALISCCISVFLVLLIDPILALRCLIVYMAVQFVENHFIYPRVVGGSVGLPPIYTLIAAMIGGRLFGIIGIIFFIPLTAVIIDWIKAGAAKRSARRDAGQSKDNPQSENKLQSEDKPLSEVKPLSGNKSSQRG